MHCVELRGISGKSFFESDFRFTQVADLMGGEREVRYTWQKASLFSVSCISAAPDKRSPGGRDCGATTG
jgi:hypothetical protein